MISNSHINNLPQIANIFIQPITITKDNYKIKVIPMNQICSEIFIQFYDLSNNSCYQQTLSHYDFNVIHDKSILAVKMIFQSQQFEIKWSGDINLDKIHFKNDQVQELWNRINPQGKYPSIVIRTFKPKMLIWLPKVLIPTKTTEPNISYYRVSKKNKQYQDLIFSVKSEPKK